VTLTASNLIAGSLRLLGVLAAGESLPADMGADCLTALNQLLDGWSTERLAIYSQTRNLFALVSGTQRYTIGTGGTWNQDRPLWIDAAAYLTSAGLEVPIRVLTRDEWAHVGQKSISDAVPQAVFYNPTFPLGAVDVYPKPTDASVQIVLYTPLAALTTVAALTTSISVPPGWLKALRYNLALELAPEYGVALDPGILAGAADSKATIKRTNEQLDELVIDSALTFTGKYSTFDIATGNF
jgi:hypothetical protein